MAAAKLKVIYLDGREDVVRISPRAQLNVEESLSGYGREKSLLAIYRLAYEALKLAGKESAPFDRWIDELIEDVEEVDDDEPSDPTPEDPSTDGSSPSASLPASPSTPSLISPSGS